MAGKTLRSVGPEEAAGAALRRNTVGRMTCKPKDHACGATRSLNRACSHPALHEKVCDSTAFINAAAPLDEN